MNTIAEPSRLFTWHMLAGLLLGAFILPFSYREWDRWRDHQAILDQRGTPVVRSSGEMIEQGGDSVTVHIAGTKLRECSIVGLQAFALDKTGVMSAANLAKQGPTTPIVTRPVGPFDAGLWRIWPLNPTAVRVRVYATHTCNGVEVRSLLAEVDIRGGG